jgi:hypothetical protein
MAMIVKDLMDEFTALATARLPWERYWRQVAAYVLPQTEGFDRLLSTDANTAITSVVGLPVAARKSKEIYDMTSLWAVDRLTAGILSLKTPEAYTWHDLGVDDDFGYQPNQAEKAALERVRDYMFRIRGNPASNFWPSHRAAMKSMCAFGDGWMFVPEVHGDKRLPYRYEYVPIVEVYPGVGADGKPNRMNRMFRRSAYQLAQQFGPKAGPKVMQYANDVKLRDQTFRVLHSIRPRSISSQGGVGVRGAKFESHYALADEDFHIGESGYYEYPFMRYAWADTGNRPFSEGPIAYALAEVRTLQELSKLEVMGAQAVLKPPLGVAGKNFTKLNWNPGVVNPGLVNPEGRPLFAPLNTGVRPDLAQTIMEQRRSAMRETLYLNLWQILVNDTDMTATEAMLRAQEKGELLGPVGISMNGGLGMLVDREVAILDRRGAFRPQSPLALPASLGNRDVSPAFTSPLDRLRRMGELIGMQRLIEFIGLIAKAKNDPSVFDRCDFDEMIETAQDILGAPSATLRDRKEVQAETDQKDNMQNVMNMLAMLQQGGDAAQAAGAGAQQLGAADQVANQNPNLRNLTSTLGNMAMQNYGQPAQVAPQAA